MSESTPESEWVSTEAARRVCRFGAVLPPWEEFPDTHPCSICWRMGGGESHMIVFDHWWESQNFSEEQRIAYLRRCPPRPAGLNG